MLKRNILILRAMGSTALAGTLALALGVGESALALQFRPPGDPVPENSAGGGVRGNIQFRPVNDEDAANTSSGGVRGNVQFRPVNDEDAANTSSGGVRGNVEFRPANDEDAANTSSGGVRGNVEFRPANDAETESSTSGGVRGDDIDEVVPLLPENGHGRTISARPQFLVYVPTDFSGEAFFSLRDVDGNHHYQTTLQVSGGLAIVALPADAPELEMDKDYQWFFAPVASGGILQPDNYGVTGWVKRVAAPEGSDRASSVIDLATLYADRGIWYDTIAMLVEARAQNPEDAELAGEWHDLLEQVGLSAIADRS